LQALRSFPIVGDCLYEPEWPTELGFSAWPVIALWGEVMIIYPFKVRSLVVAIVMIDVKCSAAVMVA
jgi:hypothetical protein